MVANAPENQGSQIIKRMRARFGEDLLRKDAALGVKSAMFAGPSSAKSGGPTTMLVTAWANTDGVDCDREVVLPKGCDWTSYFLKNNGNLFIDHCYGVSHHAGNIRDKKMPLMKRTPEGGMGWLLTGVIRTDTDIAEKKAVIEGAIAGTIGMSIGFEALDYGSLTPEEADEYPGAESIVRKCRIIEVSYTFMPCNVACQTMSVSMDEAKAARVRDLWVKGVLPASVRQRFQMPEEQPRPKTIVMLGG